MPARIIEGEFLRRTVAVDTITLDIIENALQNARREMEYVVFRSAMSTIIRDQRDAFPLITDHRGAMVVGQFGSPIAGFMRGYDGTVEDGDIFLTSDPYACDGAISHANDWLVVKPIFVDGRLMGWSGIFGHVTDIGGRVPGSEPIDANEIFEEGIVIPPTKICRNDEMQQDLVALITHNCRVPENNRADLTALIASVKLAARRVVEICRRFGLDEFEQATKLLLDRNRRAVSALIDSALTEETLYFEDFVCDDGRGNGPFKIACTMQKKGKKLYFDFSGTDAQSDGSINFLFNVEMFKMFVGAYLIKIFDPQIVFNAGYYDLLEVHIPEGSLLRPRWPAALSCRTATLQRTFDVLIGLLGQRTPELMTAAGYSQSPMLFFNGAGRKRQTFFYVGFGGVPGRPVGDGHDGYTLLPSFVNIPNEYIEVYAPILVECYEPIPDTGGPGLHRGGNGIRITFLFREAGDISVHDSRWLTYPWGVNGGLPAERSRKILLHADGTETVLPAMFDRLPVQAGDRLHFITWGGGGWGDPLKRDPELVSLEARRGLVTIEGARRYGVVLTPDLSPDAQATASLRAAMAESRGAIALIDRGGDIDDIRARCLAETGLAPPRAVSTLPPPDAPPLWTTLDMRIAEAV
jgi:N-methylhydantoinase B